MIETVEGDLFEAKAEVLVNAVNCDGVMGKGIAKTFKDRYPQMFWEYREACLKGKLQPGGIWTWANPDYLVFPAYILNMTTKRHWHDKSRREWVTHGLCHPAYRVKELGVKTVAMPAVGCGLGGLRWQDMEPHIHRILGHMLGDHPVQIWLYKPVDLG